MEKKDFVLFGILIVLSILFLSITISKEEKLEDGLIYKQQTIFGKVTILETGELKLDGRTQCSFNYFPEEKTERTIVNYSLEPLSRDIDVLNIGLGCGGTLSEILKHTNNQIDVVEINPAVIEGNRKMIDLLDNKQINIIMGEGLNYLRKSKIYDSIIIDIENPGVIHSSNLYTDDAFKIIKEKTRGTFGLWMYPCEELKYYDIIYNTLKNNFKYVYFEEDRIFISSNSPLYYKEYIPFTDTQEINTVNKKILTVIFLNKCWEGI